MLELSSSKFIFSKRERFYYFFFFTHKPGKLNQSNTWQVVRELSSSKFIFSKRERFYYYFFLLTNLENLTSYTPWKMALKSKWSTVCVADGFVEQAQTMPHSRHKIANSTKIEGIQYSISYVMAVEEIVSFSAFFVTARNVPIPRIFFQLCGFALCCLIGYSKSVNT